MTTEEPQLDLSVYENMKNSSCSKDCILVRRVLTALAYYSHLNTADNDNARLIFCNFMDEIYKHRVYDDAYHVSKCHQNKTYAVMKLATSKFKIKKCDLATCSYSDRHYRIGKTDNESKSIGDNDTKYFRLYQEVMDSMHFNIFHLFHSGLRVDMTSTNGAIECKSKEKESETEYSPYFDSLFERMSSWIKTSRDATSRFRRLGGNKYNISAINDVEPDDVFDGDTGGETFLDTIYSQLASSDELASNLHVPLKQVIDAHGYDTDALDVDLQMYEHEGESNLSHLLDTHFIWTIMNELTEIFRKAKSCVSMLGLLYCALSFCHLFCFLSIEI